MHLPNLNQNSQIAPFKLEVIIGKALFESSSRTLGLNITQEEDGRGRIPDATVTALPQSCKSVYVLMVTLRNLGATAVFVCLSPGSD